MKFEFRLKIGLEWGCILYHNKLRKREDFDEKEKEMVFSVY